jgi:hypothetical protein
MSFSGRKASVVMRDRRFSTTRDPNANNELNSKIHRQFRAAHEGHQPHQGLDPSKASTGVIWCTERAYVS